MSRLSSTVNVTGISKRKILAVIFILGSLISIFIITGIFTDIDSKNGELLDQQFNTEDIRTKVNVEQVIGEIEKEFTALDKHLQESKLDDLPPIVPLKNIVIQDRSTENLSEEIIENKEAKVKSLSFKAAKTVVYSVTPLRVNSGRDITIKNSISKKVESNIDNENYEGIDKDISSDSQKQIQATNDVPSTFTNILSDDKKEYLEKKEDLVKIGIETNTYLDSKLETPRSQYEIKAGSVIPAIMVSGLNSDLAGQITALVRHNVYDSVSRNYLLIPQGSKLIGVYDSKILYGQERVLVAWNRLIYPSGNSISLKAMPGTDLEGYSGFYDIVDNKYWKLFGTSFIIGVLTAGMQYSQNNTNPNVQIGGIGFTTSPTVGQTLSGSLGQQLGQAGLMVTQKNLNVQPTLIIKPNYPFNIMITADMILKPYKKARYK